MESAIQIQIKVEGVYVSLRANALWKGMNLTILYPIPAK